MSWSGHACWPINDSYISEALLAKTHYAQTRDAWNYWLERHDSDLEPSNAEKLLLWKVIDLTRERRSFGGEWAKVSDEAIPSSKEIMDLIDEKKYIRFKKDVENRLKQVERAAEAFVAILESEGLKSEFQNLSEMERLEYAAIFSESLPDSHVGMQYLQKTFHAPQSPISVLHPEQLANNSLVTPAILTATHRAAKAYGRIVINVMPALLVPEEEIYFKTFTRIILAGFAPAEVLDAAGSDDLQAQATAARQWFANNAPWLQKVTETAAVVVSAFDAIKLVIAARNAIDEPDGTNMLALADALVDMSLSASKYGAVKKMDKFLIGAQFVKQLTRINALYDMAMGGAAIIRSSRAYRTGDYSVAAGEAMNGLGLSVGAVASVAAVAAAASKVAVVTAFVPGLQILALTAGILALTGGLIAVTTMNTPFEQWLRNCWFGDNQEGARMEDGPDLPTYRYIGSTGRPDILRQVSTWYSILWPIRVVVEETGVANFYSVKCDGVPNGPKLLAYHGSQILISRIDGPPSITGPNSEIIYGPRAVDDDPVLGGAERGGSVHFDADGSGRLISWSAIFKMKENITSKWMEVQISLPSRSQDNSLNIFAPELSGLSLSLVTMTRTQVKKASDEG